MEQVSFSQPKTLVQNKFEELYAQGKLLPGELDAPCIADLETLSQEQACMALDFLVNVTKTTINNKSAFLKGIIAKSRAKGLQARTSQTFAPTGFFALHPIVQAKFDTVFSSGVAKREEIDPSIFDSMSQFDPLVACQIVDIFAQKDMSKIRSKSGFLAGIMKRFREKGAAWYPPRQYFPTMAYPAVGLAPFGYSPALQYPTYLAPGKSPVAIYPNVQTVPPTSYSKVLSPVVQDRLNSLYDLGILSPTELDTEILESLAQFPAEIGLSILDKFSKAELSSIQNKNGFLAGIMKRFRGGTRCVNVRDNQHAQAQLPASVQAALEELYATGLVQRTELDLKVFSLLRDIDEDAAVDAVLRFQSSRLSHVTNRSGFLVGIINKVKSERAATSSLTEGL
uniref:Heterogeneous nuclear ribonucleoprotein R n=1 Tax=Euglena gracilis TaxID=3039 RepID=A0AA51UB44_EUGGR|nr:heterogeneous nuclear ribonucleoprotein R [Euglena gracilis]BDX17173.1 heterogeneous nuclear ribonucleoprotein R [Euglena gracilis]|eukprot:EG_transcript_2670